MSTARQGMSLIEIDQIIAQRVTNAIEAIAIYKERTHVTRDSMDQVARQGAKFLGHVVNQDGIHVDPSKFKSVKNWKNPESPTEIHSFLGLAGYYQSDYECEIKYHPVKEIVVADALSRKGRLKPRRIPSVGGVKKLIMDEAYTSRYLVHLGANKMYYDLRDLYWWPGMKRNISRLTKSAHFLPIREDYKTEKLVRIYINKILARHGVPVSIILDRDGRFISHLWQALQKALGTKLNMSIAYHPETDDQSERTIQTLEDMLRACVMDFGGSWVTHLLLVEFSYNNSYHKSIKYAPFEALYGCKCISTVIWAEVGESQLIGPEIVQEITEKIIQIKKRLKTTRSRQKNYADKRRKPLEFKVRDQVLFKVSPWKGVVQFDSNLQVSLEEINVDDKLYFLKEPVEIVDRQVKKLKRSWIPIVKVAVDFRCSIFFVLSCLASLLFTTRLVDQGYSQQESIDYDETFALVARLKAIKIFLAFSTCLNFIVYHMDVKSEFLNGKLKEEVYFKQPSSFESNEFPNHVCKLDKALYGLKQAPRSQDPTTPYFEPERFIHQTSRKKKKRNPFIPIEDRVPKSKYPPFDNLFEAEVVYNPFRDLPFPMADDQPMLGNNHVVAPTLGATIIAVDLGDNFTVKGHHLSMIKDRQFNGCSRADPYKHIAEFVEVCGMFRYGNTNADAIKLNFFHPP
nr:putative reverse transcriptase domain-containing protein [Tanacetum cinerariifolium]